MRMDQKELASILGINRVTLSRALNDSPRVSEELKERVKQACIDVGYRPNFYARGLIRQQTRTISVLCTGLPMTDLHSRWVGEIQGQVLSRGYRLRLDTGIALDSLLSEDAADGFIIFGSSADVDTAKLRAELCTLPAVFTDCAYSPTARNVVATDNAGGVALAIDHLASRGTAA